MNFTSIGGYYRSILEKVYNYLSKHGELSFEDLRKWAKSEGIGLASLTAILNDLLNENRIFAPQGFMEVEDIICSFTVPKIISTNKSVGEVSATKVEIESKPSAPQSVIKTSVEKTDLDWMKDPDLKRAIEYLNKYHSVGVIRFILDLSDMGVSNPDNLLKKLISIGYVDYSHSGVINASRNLPKISDKRLLSEYI
ncbi:MAG: hypothetical protein QXI93_04785 [Candidatus Methanomethylicia archaeon]